MFRRGAIPPLRSHAVAVCDASRLRRRNRQPCQRGGMGKLGTATVTRRVARQFSKLPTSVEPRYPAFFRPRWNDQRDVDFCLSAHDRIYYGVGPPCGDGRAASTFCYPNQPGSVAVSLQRSNTGREKDLSKAVCNRRHLVLSDKPEMESRRENPRRIVLNLRASTDWISPSFFVGEKRRYRVRAKCRFAHRACANWLRRYATVQPDLDC